MATGQRFQNIPFEDLFDPDIVGDGPVAQGYRDSNGQPLRFAHIKYGQRRADVGRRIAGVGDLANLWAAKGTAQYEEVRVPEFGIFGASYQGAAPNGHAGVTFWPDAKGVVTYTNSPNARTFNNGQWLIKGSPQNFEGLFSIVEVYEGNVPPPYNQWRNMQFGLGYSFDVVYGQASALIRMQIRRVRDGVIMASGESMMGCSHSRGNEGGILT